MDLEVIKQQMLADIDSDISLEDEIEAIAHESAIQLEKYNTCRISFQGRTYSAGVAFPIIGEKALIDLRLVNEFDLRFQNPNSKVIKSAVEPNPNLSMKENLQDLVAETLRYLCDKTTIVEESV